MAVDLFRFVALRAADRTAPARVTDLATLSKFEQALAGIHQNGHRNQDKLGVLQSAGRVVDQFAAGGFGPGPVTAADSAPWEPGFDQLYAAALTALKASELASAINAGFGKKAKDLVNDAAFQAFSERVRDTIVAVFIKPSLPAVPIADLAQIARLIGLITRVAATDASLDQPGVIQSALTETLVLPASIFPLRADLPQPVGVGDLLVVKQQLKRYEAGDVANIENILTGEKRDKINRHSLTTDNTQITQTTKETETTKSLDVTERFELKSEVQNVVKEDLSTNAGVNVSAKYGSVEINANANVAYSLSKQQSSMAASDHAKDVTSRAASRVTETVMQEEISRTIEVLAEKESHSFDNTGAGKSNVSGVYQWVNKVYEAQVFNYGKRLLVDLTVPEPAAFVLDALGATEQAGTIIPPEPFALVLDAGSGVYRPIAPDDLGGDGLIKPGVTSRPITPSDLAPDPADLTYYGKFVGKFAAVGVNAPPEPMTTVSKSLTGNKDDHDHLAVADDLTIPQGYQAQSIAAQGAFTIYEQEDGDERMWVFVGKQRFECQGAGPLGPKAALLPDPADQLVNEQGTMPIAVETQQARDFAITVDITCVRTAEALAQWQLDTHGTLVNAYTNLMSAYHDKVAAAKIQQTQDKSLGDNPLQNRLIERAELKKACISMLAGIDLYAADLTDVQLNTPPPAFPRPNIPSQPNPNIVGQDQAAFIRFFEQAFEWEHMMYLFYPYYWKRRDQWYESALTDNPDPLFAEFLKAGSARVVVPVRLQLEGDVRYYFMTGQIWTGGAMPSITDSDYLSITEEIKARDDVLGTETPQGDPWDVTLPTTLIKLRSDDTLPIWEKFTVNSHDQWVPGRMVNEKWVPDYGKLDAQGHWTPQ